MLYFNLIEPIISKNKNLSDEEIEEEIRKAFRKYQEIQFKLCCCY